MQAERFGQAEMHVRVLLGNLLHLVWPVDLDAKRRINGRGGAQPLADTPLHHVRDDRDFCYAVRDQLPGGAGQREGWGTPF